MLLSKKLCRNYKKKQFPKFKIYLSQAYLKTLPLTIKKGMKFSQKKRPKRNCKVVIICVQGHEKQWKCDFFPNHRLFGLSSFIPEFKLWSHLFNISFVPLSLVTTAHVYFSSLLTKTSGRALWSIPQCQYIWNCFTKFT